MPEKLISLIIPVYNTEKLLPRCLDSVLAQSHPQFEALLVDDGSPDRSGEVCDAYAARDSRIRVIHQKNAGVSAARNRGIAEAKGEFVQFVDSDDYLEPDHCSSLLSGMIDSDVDAVVGGIANTVVRDGREVSRNLWQAPRLGRMAGVDALRMLYRPTSDEMKVLLMPSNKLCRRRVLVDNHVEFPVGMHPVEDNLFSVDMYGRCREVMFISNGGYRYVNDVSDGGQSAMLRYNLWEFRDYIRFCSLYQDVMERLTGDREQTERNHACASVMVATTVRCCRSDASYTDAEIRAILADSLGRADVRSWLADYRPGPGQSRLIPFLMRRRWTRPLLHFARKRADKRYGLHQAGKRANGK